MVQGPSIILWPVSPLVPDKYLQGCIGRHKFNYSTTTLLVACCAHMLWCYRWLQLLDRGRRYTHKVAPLGWATWAKRTDSSPAHRRDIIHALPRQTDSSNNYLW